MNKLCNMNTLYNIDELFVNLQLQWRVRINSHQHSALFHGICAAPFTGSLKVIFSLGPGNGAPLSSYLELALYKFHR